MDHGFLAPADILTHFPVAPGMVVGECGVSGSGQMIEALSATVGPDGKVLAFDVNKNVLSALEGQARLRHLTNVFPIWTNLEVIGGTKEITDHQLDAAMAVHLFHESNHHLEILTELHRLLKPGSALVVVDWTKESTHPLAPPTNRRLAVGYLSQLASTNGYKETSIFTPDPDHWGIVLTTT